MMTKPAGIYQRPPWPVWVQLHQATIPAITITVIKNITHPQDKGREFSSNFMAKAKKVWLKSLS